jgi:membrane-associated phospholipid phosphatase
MLKTMKRYQVVGVLCVLWVGLISGRPLFLELHCQKNPMYCNKARLPSIDQACFGSFSSQADQLSYWTQNGSLICVLGFIGWFSFVKRQKRLGIVYGMTLLKAVSVNGIINEITHIVIQRPRPQVYLDPTVYGDRIAHYTSFYSGHTSFTGICMMFLVVSFYQQFKSRFVLYLLIFIGGFWTALTGALRVQAGKHFFTDVLVGALMGLVIAWFVGKKIEKYELI